MTNVLLSADGDIKVYSVPDVIAKNLDAVCMEFSSMGGSFDEEDFIDWLNRYRYPYEKSVYVENIGWCQDESEIPAKYQGCKWFNF